MFSSLMRARNRVKRSGSRSSSPAAIRRPLLQGRGEGVVEQREGEEQVQDEGMIFDDEQDDDEDDVETPLLPIFASEHLGKSVKPWSSTNHPGREWSTEYGRNL